jgi:hypothetical protein
MRDEKARSEFGGAGLHGRPVDMGENGAEE